MKAMLVAMVLGLSVVGCGGGGSTGQGGGGGSQTCQEQHDCINGSCKCTSGPKKDSACCDPDSTTCTTNKCDTFCRYCE